MKENIAESSWGCPPPGPPNYMWKKPNLLAYVRCALLGFLPTCKHIFPIIDQSRFFSTSGIGPDILMNVLEDCIVFLNWVAWFCLTFILKAKTTIFSLELYWKCLLLISFHRGIWSTRYSEINKFKLSKDLPFQK